MIASRAQMFEVAIVVPCFNEEKRLDREEMLRLARSPGVRLFLVDDGSRDATIEVLRELEARAPESVTAVAFEKNRGKAEAVRDGMRKAAAAGVTVVGFADADLATPVDELLRLASYAQGAEEEHVFMGARVAMAGMAIRRHATRHYVGRLFSTAASLALDAQFYDTQCGAKFFRNTPLFRASLEERFRSRWIFDVELLARLLHGVEGHEGLPLSAFREVPLRQWTDVGDSRVRVSELTDVGTTLLRIARHVRSGR